MKIALFVGFVFFCSTWSIGLTYRNCYSCSSTTYKDCEQSQKVMVCYDTYPCIQMYTRFDNGTLKAEWFFKGCTHHRACEQFSKGNLTLDEDGCWPPSAKCIGKCCYEEECNKGNILADEIAGLNTGKALAISTSVVGLFFGLSLITACVNCN